MWRRQRWRRDGFHVIQVRREKYTIEHAHCAGFFETKPLEKVPLTHLIKLVASFTRTEVAKIIAWYMGFLLHPHVCCRRQ